MLPKEAREKFLRDSVKELISAIKVPEPKEIVEDSDVRAFAEVVFHQLKKVEKKNRMKCQIEILTLLSQHQPQDQD